jgi:hypothetical protein
MDVALWLPMTLILTIGLLKQPTKDAIVALQWSTGLRGFERWKRSGVGQSMDDQISDGAATKRHGWLGRSASWA